MLKPIPQIIHDLQSSVGIPCLSQPRHRQYIACTSEFDPVEDAEPVRQNLCS